MTHERLTIVIYAVQKAKHGNEQRFFRRHFARDAQSGTTITDISLFLRYVKQG